MIDKHGIQELIKSRLTKAHSWSHDVDVLLLKLPLFAELLETQPNEIVELGIWASLPENL